MIASCPACSSRFHVRESTSAGTAEAATCPRCSTRFLVHAVRVQAPPERPAGLPPGAGRDVAGTAAPASSQNISELDFSVVGITWRVHRGPSLPVYELHRLQDLRGFLSTGQITPADQLSHDGNRWVDIASITDLEAYFWSVWQMALNPGEVPTVLSSQHEASVERLESEVTERPTEAQAAWFNAQTILPVEQEGGAAEAAPLAAEGRGSPVQPVAARSFDLLGEQITGTSEALVPMASSATPPPAESRPAPELEIAGAVDASEERTVTAHEAATEPTKPHRRRRSAAAAQVVSEVGPEASVLEEDSPLPTTPIEGRPPVPVPSAPAPIPIPGPADPSGSAEAAVASVAVPGGPSDRVAEVAPPEPASRQPAPTVVPVQPPHLEEPGSYTAARPPAPLAVDEPAVRTLAGVVDLEPSNVFTEGDLGLGEEDLDDPPRVGGTTTPPMEATVPRPGLSPVLAASPAPLRRQPTESLRPTLLKGGPSAPVQVVAPQPPGAPRPAPRGGVAVRRRRRPVWGRSASIMAAAFAGGVSLTIGAFTLALVIAAMFGFDPTSAPEQMVEGLSPRADATEDVVTAPGTAPQSASPIPVVTPPVAPAPRRRSVRTPRPAAASRGATMSGVKPPEPSPRPDYAPASSGAEVPAPPPAPDDEVPGLPSDLDDPTDADQSASGRRDPSAPIGDPRDLEPPGPLISRDGEPDPAPKPVPAGGVEVRELLPLKEEGSSSEAERAPSPVPAPEEE